MLCLFPLEKMNQKNSSKNKRPKLEPRMQDFRWDQKNEVNFVSKDCWVCIVSELVAVIC